MRTVNVEVLKHRLRLYQLNCELLQLLYRSSKYYPAGDPELKERIIYANGKRNDTFEAIYNMVDDKQALLEAVLQLVNDYRSPKKQMWYYEVALHIEKNMKLRKE
jgi:hypothetical protein